MSRLRKIAEENFWSDLRDLMKSDFTPRNRSYKDKLSYCKFFPINLTSCIDAVLINACLLLTYSLLSSFMFSPWYAGFTVGIWIAIVELTIVLLIKYYQTYYQVIIHSINFLGLFHDPSD
jgi:sterol desaturase/sphingolipid hydroxylase (fatty acid hydroxylase superfamily)